MCDDKRPYGYLSNNGADGYDLTNGATLNGTSAYVYDNFVFNNAVVGHDMRTFADGSLIGGLILPHDGVYSADYFMQIRDNFTVSIEGPPMPGMALLLRTRDGRESFIVPNSAVFIHPDSIESHMVLFKAKCGDQLSLVNNSITTAFSPFQGSYQFYLDGLFANPSVNVSLAVNLISK